MSEELQLQTPYLRLAARAWGDGPPLLALHGWLDNAASFDRLAPLLPEWRLVALDLPGHGLSQWRAKGVHYHFIDFVADVMLAADALGWKRFTLLGHSLGASIAAFTAATAPDRVERLLLIEGLGPFSAAPDEGPTQLAIAIAQTQRLRQKGSPVYPRFEQAAYARQKAGDLSYPAAVALANRGLQSVADGVGWRSDPALTLRSPIYLSEEQVLAFLAAIRAPTLLIQAKAGILIKREGTAKRLHQLAGVQIRTLPGGHHLHLDDPQPTATAIREFLTAQR